MQEKVLTVAKIYVGFVHTKMSHMKQEKMITFTVGNCKSLQMGFRNAHTYQPYSCNFLVSVVYKYMILEEQGSLHPQKNMEEPILPRRAGDKINSRTLNVTNKQPAAQTGT